jgi:hypothetical protein
MCNKRLITPVRLPAQFDSRNAGQILIKFCAGVMLLKATIYLHF